MTEIPVTAARREESLSKAVSCGNLASGNPLASPLYRNIAFRPRATGMSFSRRQQGP
jgi:hypothetical protein